MASPKASKEDQVQALFTKLAPLIKGQQHKKAVRTIDSSELSCVVGKLNRATAYSRKCSSGLQSSSYSQVTKMPSSAK